jgi:hypothetical protein|tara:strand:+ start:142 stop:747 length:606 start_codon:yes stop_codon:yes gene_type:complete
MLINERIYFIHIPRTGGRYLNNWIVLNKHKAEHWLFREHYKNKEIPHLPYPDYEQFLGFIPEEKFTIVREPVERFYSIIQYNHYTKAMTDKEFNSIFDSKNSFFNFMNKMRLGPNNHGHWYNMQCDFISKDVKIYRFENGLRDPLKKWLDENFGLKLPVGYRDAIGTQTGLIEDGKKLILNKDQVNWVKDYYYKDYKLLDY